MLLSNFTFNLSVSHSGLFRNWIRQELERQQSEVSLLRDTRIFHLLTEVNGDGHTYAVQLFFDTAGDLDLYDQQHKDAFLDRLDRIFSGQYAFFQTVLESI